MKILVVNDVHTELQVLEALLRAMDHEVVVADSGAQAIAIYQALHLDLVLLDVDMPDISGYEVARRLRAIGGRDWISIIFLSDVFNDEELAWGVEAGGDDFLAKPLTRTALLAKLQAVQRITELRQRLEDVTAQLAQTYSQLEKANRELQYLTNQDDLTGVASRRYFNSYLSREWKRAVRSGQSLSLIIADVDHFHAYTELHGSQAGGDYLKRVAFTLTAFARRPADMVARFGGQEFAILLPETPAEGTQALREHLRQALDSLTTIHTGCADPYIRVSLGAATITPVLDSTPASLLAAAEQALLWAKQQNSSGAIPNLQIQ